MFRCGTGCSWLARRLTFARGGVFHQHFELDGPTRALFVALNPLTLELQCKNTEQILGTGALTIDLHTIRVRFAAFRTARSCFISRKNKSVQVLNHERISLTPHRMCAGDLQSCFRSPAR